MEHARYKTKLTSLLRDKKAFFFKENEICVVYINDKPVNKFHLKRTCAFVQFVPDDLFNETAILSIVTNIKCRGSGLASFLLMVVAEYSDNIVVLDDASDNCFCSNNVYLNNGFHYINEGEPEMEASSTHIMAHMKNFKSKYCGNSFFK